MAQYSISPGHSSGVIVMAEVNFLAEFRSHMLSMNGNDVISVHLSDPEGFRSLEEVCTHKINEVIDINSCKSELALLYNNRGHAKYMQVEFESAIEDYSKALQLNPNLAVAYYNRGTIYYRMGDFKGAFNDMQKAIDMDPSNVEFRKGYKECVKMNSMQTQ